MSTPSSSVNSGVIDLAPNYKGFQIHHGSGKASATIAYNGATVTSWKILDQEMLFVSPKHVYSVGKAVRGGIPVVFPQFGPGPLPQHGFARSKLWKQGELTMNKSNGDVSIKFHLTEDEETLKVWPYKFELILTVKLLGTSLSQQLTIINKDEKDFTFTTLLHSYFNVDSIEKVNIFGLQGVNYIDKVDSGKIKTEENKSISISSETDRVYINGGANSVTINDKGNAEILIKTSGFNDFVVWNPWAEKAKAMADLGEENYRKFVCVEAGSVAEPVPLKAGQTWNGAQGLSLKLVKKED